MITKNFYYIRHDKPEIPFDAHQGYLEFYRPAIHIMRQLNDAEKLNEAQKYFFEDKKDPEELYLNKFDPHQIKNVSHKPKFKNKIEKLRSILIKEEERFTPKSKIVQRTTPASVKILNWLKTEHPEVIDRMKTGEEVGLSYWKKQFDKKNNNEN